MQARGERLAATPDRRLPAHVQISASVKGDIIKLPAGMHLPDGTPVCVVVDEVPRTLPPDYFERVSGALAAESFERPEQGEF